MLIGMLGRAAEIRRDRHGVHMRIDEARHERPASDIDDDVGRDVDRAIGDFTDEPILDEDGDTLTQLQLRRL